MQSIIALIQSALPCPVAANRTRNTGECCVYDFYYTSYNGSRREARLKASIFAADMERGLELEGMLDSALVKRGEEPLTATVTSCTRNGGGWLTDGDRHIRIVYYDIVMRA